MEAIRAERREKGCNSETSAQIALKIKFGKEKVVSKRKGKWNLYHPSKRAKRFERSEGSVVTQKLVLRSSSDLYALDLSMMEPKATSWLWERRRRLTPIVEINFEVSRNHFTPRYYFKKFRNFWAIRSWKLGEKTRFWGLGGKGGFGGGRHLFRGY